MTTYKVIRFFEDDILGNCTIAKGLTIEEAQAHCNNPETSSSTCTSREGLERTERYGRWFDGWTEEA